MKERLARHALLALCLLAPIVYLPRVLLGRETPLPASTPPSWTHLVLLTVGAWPQAAAAATDPSLSAFDLRASRVASLYAPASASAASAASLWTGLYPRSHGVLGNDRALAPGAWTLARAARSAGTRTAAFLAEPFVSATGIGGFDEVREEAGASAAALCDAAADFLERARGDRVLVWVHLAGGADVGAAVERLQSALRATDRAPESLLALVVLARERDAAGAATAFDAPLRAALPGALEAGRRSRASLSLVDLPAVLLLMLGLHAAPDAPPDARPELLWTALRGGHPEPGVLVQAALDGGRTDIFLRGERRAVLDAERGAARAEARVAGAWQPLQGEEAERFLAEARAASAGLQAPRGPAPPAVVPPGDWPPGW